MRKKRWTPDMEGKIKEMLSIAKNQEEAIKYLQQHGLNDNDVDSALHRFYPNGSRNNFIGSSTNEISISNRIPLSSHEQQIELIGFSQSVSDKIIFDLSNNICTAFILFSHPDSYAKSRCA